MNNIYRLLVVLTSVSALMVFASCSTRTDNLNSLILWYKQPAVEWTDALPVGNGRLGAMVFGNTDIERIQLNEESLWAGSKINNDNPEALSHLNEIRQLLLNGYITRAYELSEKYLLGTPPRVRSYQTLGDLWINLQSNSDSVTDYRRELDLRKGLIHTKFRKGDVTYSYDVFASAPDNVIVVKLTAMNGKINSTVSLKRRRNALIKAVDHGLEMEGQIIDQDSPEFGIGGEHMRFAARVKVRNQGGNVTVDGDSLIIREASALILFITAATDYNRDILNVDSSIEPATVCQRILNEVEQKSYNTLFAAHLADHQELFNRVELNLSNELLDTIPTDLRLKRVIAGEEDKHLEELYFQYGRYLLMGSSRAPGVLPANLQGIWNPHFDAPWNSDYHTNINLQMNYWLADVCNLPETTEPLIGFMEKITIPGRETASKMYGCRGWTMHHNTDPYGRTGLMDGIQWGTFPMAGPWMTLHLWDHFCYTNDTAYLNNRAWPVMRESARFVLDFLSEDKKGQWMTSPSYSPENAYYLPGTRTPMQLTYGATMDIQIVRELFMACIQAAGLIGDDPALVDSMQLALTKIPPTQIGSNGTIMEWIEDYEEAEPGHRHISHLFGLHPGTQITPQTPELFEAAARTIEHRLANGGGHTGWSRAWIINFYARLLDGEKAHQHLQSLLAKSTLTNLFDTHPPFQIDGNFGGTAGMTEMLLQSHNGFIHVLPALPQAWKDGSVKGLIARGNFKVDITWHAGELHELIIKANTNSNCKIQYKSFTIEFPARKGETYTFGPELVKM